MVARIRTSNFTISPIQKTLLRLFRLMITILIVTLLLPWMSRSPAYASDHLGIPEALACSDPLGCVEIAPGSPVHIGYALTITGAYSYLGIDERNAIELAIDDVGGKILGRNILFNGVDEGCSEAGGLAAGTTLAADTTIVAVIGTSCSPAARTTMPILSAAGFSMVSPSNTASTLTEPGNPDSHPGYLRTSWNDKDQAALAAKFAWQYLGVSTAATIRDGSLYSSNLQNSFVSEFTRLGGTITNQLTISVGQTDMSGVLTAIAAGHPGLIYMPVFMPEGGHLINQAKSTSGLHNTILISPDSMYGENVGLATGQNVEGFLTTGPDTTKYTSAYTSSFLPAYYAKFGYNPSSMFHIYAYDAFMMIKAAIEAVATVQPDTTIQIGRQALRNAMYATTDFPGLTGKLTCNPTGDCASNHLGVFKYHVGQYPPELIWPYIFDDVPVNFWAWSWIERLYRTGITGGCSTSPLAYCPEQSVTRAQMAIFLERGIRGSSYAPPDVGASTGFNDVPTNYWSAAWIKQLAADGITSGCGGNNYCPDTSVTRAQMAIFLLKAKYGSSYTPPAIGSSTGFSDVAASYWAAPWIKQLAAEGITGGCGTNIYCPENAVTRAEMAVFLVKTFNLP